MNVQPVRIDSIHVPRRMRAVDQAKVAALAESMSALGLLQPITVCRSDEGHVALMAGAHRLLAAKNLGWSHIDAASIEGLDDIGCQLVEIDENLIRADLTPTQQAEHLARRKTLWEARKSQVGEVRSPTKPQHERGFASETSAETGVSKRTVNQALARAEAVPQDVRDKIRGSAFDSGAYLDRLGKLSPDGQRKTVTADLEEFKLRRQDAAPSETAADHFERLKRAYLRTRLDGRRRFEQWLDWQQRSAAEYEPARLHERLERALSRGELDGERNVGFTRKFIKKCKRGLDVSDQEILRAAEIVDLLDTDDLLEVDG